MGVGVEERLKREDIYIYIHTHTYALFTLLYSRK